MQPINQVAFQGCDPNSRAILFAQQNIKQKQKITGTSVSKGMMQYTILAILATNFGNSAMKQSNVKAKAEIKQFLILVLARS